MKPQVCVAAIIALVITSSAQASEVTTLPVSIWGSGVTLERASNWLDRVNQMYATNGVKVRFELAGVGPTKWGAQLYGIAGITIEFPPDDDWANSPSAVGRGCANSLPLFKGSCFYNSLRQYLLNAAPEYDPYIARVIAHEFGHNFSLDHTPGTIMDAHVTEDTDFNAEQVAILNDAVRQAAVPPVTAALGGLLLNGRFTLQAKWKTQAGAEGTGKPVALTADSGYLWFFADSNIEATAKVLNACGLNERFWVFIAGMTNVQVDLTVTDFDTGGIVDGVWMDRTIKTYQNPIGRAFLPIQDTGAFATCNADTAEPASLRPDSSLPPPDPRTWRCGN